MSTRVAREQSIEQSLQDFITQALTDKGLPVGTQIEMRDAFEQREFDGPLDADYIVLGFNFDGGGVPIEIGSNRRIYRHTIEVFVIATTAKRGANMAYLIRDSLEDKVRVPLLDVSQDGRPQIDVILIDPVAVERQPVPDPEPWQEFVWLLRIPVVDEYDPSG